MSQRKLMSKQIKPYLDFVLGLDATQFDLLCDSIFNSYLTIRFTIEQK